MMHKRLFIVAIAVCFLGISTNVANAIDRNCPKGQTWDPNQGACVKKRGGAKKSPAKKYDEALDLLDGDGGRKDATRGIALLEESCAERFAAACTQLGFLYLNGRHLDASAMTAAARYERACELGDLDGCVGAADIASRGMLGGVDHQRAIGFLESACTKNHPRACYELAKKVQTGLGSPKDAVKAEGLYLRAYELLKNDCPARGPSCYLLGVVYWYGRGTPKDAKLAFDAWKRGCEAGSGDSCFQLAIAYRMGNGTAKSEATAMKTYDRACRVYENAAACHDAGVILGQRPESEREPTVLLDYGKRACELDKRQCDLLAHLLSTGKGGRQDPEESSRLYDIACTHGSDVSCSSLGHRLFSAIGVKQDARRAVEVWVRACTMGHGGACKSAAEQYYYGKQVGKDLKRAYGLFTDGCDHDNAQACHWAGAMHLESSSGVGNVDLDLARTLIERACTMGRPQGCTAAARIYRDGRGVPADAAKARALYMAGCDGVAEGADDDACDELGQLLYFQSGDAAVKLDAALAYEKACKLGKAEPCRWLESVFRDAQAGPKDVAHARDTLANACANADAPNEAACVALAQLYRDGGYLAPKQPREAVKLLAASCERKYGDACTEYAVALSQGIGVVADQKRAEALFAEQCDAGITAACAGLGNLEWRRKRYAAAVALFRRTCEEDTGGSCTMLGFAAYTAMGTAWDVNESATAWERGCKLNDLTACANLGELYEFGIGVARDSKLAREHYEKGCTAYATYACGRAARYYEIGDGVAIDLDRAEREYTRACDDPFPSPEACLRLSEMWRAVGRGSASAIAKLEQKAFGAAERSHADNPYFAYLLGRFYENGVTVVANPARALELYADACDRYDPLGCVAAGERYLEGRGTKIDRERAAVRFDRACAAGLREGCEGAALARRAPPAPEKAPTTPPGKVTKRSACACVLGAAATGNRGESSWPLLVIGALGLIALRRRRR